MADHVDIVFDGPPGPEGNRFIEVEDALGRLLHSETFEDGGRLLEECGARGLEGVVAKHRASIYRSGRSTSWVKVKCPAWREANRNRGELFGEARER